MKKGDVILIPFPYTDMSGNKTRPVLVLNNDIYDVTVAFITSKIVKKELNDVEWNYYPPHRTG
jgi:mRNA interferase MazF